MVDVNRAFRQFERFLPGAFREDSRREVRGSGCYCGKCGAQMDYTAFDGYGFGAECPECGHKVLMEDDPDLCRAFDAEQMATSGEDGG